MGRDSKRTYNKEFIADAIKLALKSPSVRVAANNLGIPISTLHTWIKKQAPVQDSASENNSISTAMQKELNKLRKENARLQEEREILKKAATFFAGESK